MTSVRAQSLLWLAQRTSAALLAVCVVVHLATMIVAVRGGLTAAEILARTRGSAVWATFYGVFVLAAAIHAPIGVRTVVAEMRGGPHRVADGIALLLGVVIAALGARAVVAVTGS